MNRLRAWREGVRRTPGGRHLLKLAVFVLGLLFVLLGVVLVVLPGPLTIPPILLGVYIWSTEFRWADRLKERAIDSAREAWAAARRRPLTSALATGGGVALAVVGAVVVRRYDVVDRLMGSFG